MWEQFWSGLQINAAFWVHFGHRSASRQSVVRTCLLQCRDCCAIDVPDSNVCCCFLCLSLKLIFFLSLSFIKASAAARRFHCKKAATSWTSQGSRSVSSISRSSLQHQHHLRHHPQSTHTCYTYSPANITVSTSVNWLLIIGALVCPTLFVFSGESSLVCLEVKIHCWRVENVTNIGDIRIHIRVRASKSNEKPVCA